jgi:hypothetical protein
MTGATKYEINVYTGTATPYTLSSGPIYTTSGTSYPLTGLISATNYQVEDMVNNDGALADDGTKVELSRWSTVGTFMTDYDMSAPTPTNPAQGADEVSLHPSFGWSAVEHAVTYTIQISADPTFTTGLIAFASVTVTAYSYTGDELDYDQDYYWRVRAVAPNGTVSPWSTFNAYYIWELGAISNFHTEEEEIPPVTVTQTIQTIALPTGTTTIVVNIPDITVPVPAVTVNIPADTTTVTSLTLIAPDRETPVYIWAIVAIGALLTIAVIILIIRTRRVV